MNWKEVRVAIDQDDEIEVVLLLIESITNQMLTVGQSRQPSVVTQLEKLTSAQNQKATFCCI